MAKQIKIPKQPKPRKIIISTEFVINLARVKSYGEELFGKTVGDKFVREIRQKIAFLGKHPDANPKNRFLESTERKKTGLACLIMVALLIISGITELKAQDWPQYLGPDRNSTSSQKGLLKKWPASGPEVLWSIEVGKGYGGPVIKNGKVYLLDRDDEVGDFMRCFNLQNGEELWRYSYDSPGEFQYPGSRSVPVVDDNHVYSVGAYGELLCIDLQTRQPVWRKNIFKDFEGEKLPNWGISQSPFIYENMLIVSPQAPQAGVVAYDKLTGDVVWQTPKFSEGRTGDYVSPKVIKIHGEDHVVMTTSSSSPRTSNGKVTGIAPRTGEILWQITGWECITSIPCPVDAGDNKLLIAGGYNLGSMMIQINKNPEGTFEIVELFKTVEFGDQTKPPLFYDGHFYAMYRTHSRRDGLVCMNSDGEIMWKTGLNPGFDRGSMILADGLILASDGMSTLYLIEPDPTKFKPVSSIAILKEGGAAIVDRAADSTQNWAPLALSDGKLLIRDQNRMFCLKVAE